MAKVKANNIEIEYETFGGPSSNPLLLVNGRGSQMIRYNNNNINTNGNNSNSKN